MQSISRRTFVKTAVGGAGVASARVGAPFDSAQGGQQPTNRVSGYDHVALPMQNTDAMVAFYKKLGFQVRENANAVSVYAET